MSTQFIRRVGLIVYGVNQIGQAAPSATGVNSSQSSSAASTPGTVSQTAGAPASTGGAQTGLDLSAFRIVFRTQAQDVDCPPLAQIRVYNLSDSTARRVQKEFQNVSLQAGYVGGNYGVIFQGSIVRVRRGRERNNVDTFVDIMAANLDAVYNYGAIAKSLAAGSTLMDRVNAIQQGVANSPAAQGSPNALAAGMQYGNIPDSFNTGGTLPRGKVLFGMASDHLTDAANAGNCTWSVGPDGRVNFIPNTGYLPGTAVVLTAQTGLIGVPEATQAGIELECLLNPYIKTGTRVQLDNASITMTAASSVTGYPSYTDLAFYASLNADGFYKTLVVEHEGDTWNDAPFTWKSSVIALNVDASAAPGSSVSAYGW